MQTFMIIERFDPVDLDAIYKRLNQDGRGLPDGLHFVESWLTADNKTVYQIMRTDNAELFDVWFEHWDDLIEFEVVALREKPTAS